MEKICEERDEKEHGRIVRDDDEFKRRNPYKCYAFCNDKVVDDEASDDIEGNLSEKKSGKSIPKRLIGSSKAQLMRTIQNWIAILEQQSEKEWMAKLKGMPDLDEDLVSDAVDFLRGDSDDAQIFLALTAELRKRWLIRNRPNLLCYPPKPSLHQVSPT
ncbi:hypothetical protein MKW92_044960 [Papaver armeniacum]|nr:hypothetical protein MKW92_044960 [Papaver armeniacum]